MKKLLRIGENDNRRVSTRRTGRLIAFVFPTILGVCTWSTADASGTDCRSNQLGVTRIEMCMARGAGLGHDRYILKADGVDVFALADDYAEDVEMKHTLLHGPTIEFTLSRQGGKVTVIKGGCVPVSEQQPSPFLKGASIGVEVARICNFTWGTQKVVDNVRFDFN